MAFKIPVEIVHKNENQGIEIQQSIQEIKGYKLTGKAR